MIKKFKCIFCCVGILTLMGFWNRVDFVYSQSDVNEASIDQSQEDMEMLENISDPLVRQVVALSSRGLTKEQIASQMNLSVDEVELMLSDSGNLPDDSSSQTQNFSEISNQSSGPARVEVSADANGKLDMLDLRNMEVMDVLKLVSQKSGVNIVASQNTKGTVSVYLKNVTVEEALKIIVESNDWAYVRENVIIKVMTGQEYEARLGYRFGKEVETRIIKLIYASATDVLATLSQIKNASGKVISDEKSNTLIIVDTLEKLKEMDMIVKQLDVPTETKVFDLSYAKAEDLSGKLTETLTPVIGKSRFDVRSNRLVITDTPRKLGEIAKIVDAFDQKHKEVYIEAKIIQVVLSDTNKTGVNWQGIVRDYHNLKLKNAFGALSDTDPGSRLSIGTVDSDDYDAVIEALRIVGRTNILSSPRIATVNNQEAKILVGSSEPYVTSTTTTPASGSPTTAESVNFIETGVKLFVTPTIHNDGFITMKIKPEVSSVTSRLETSNKNTIPIVETSQAETTVMVKDNVTIVIGGLIKDEKIFSSNKIPLLSDVPFLGRAFKSESESVKKTEIVIFLTPKIVTGDLERISTGSDHLIPAIP